MLIRSEHSLWRTDVRHPANTIEDMKKILFGYRDDMRVEIESGIARNSKNRGGPSHTPHVVGRLGLRHQRRP